VVECESWVTRRWANTSILKLFRLPHSFRWKLRCMRFPQPLTMLVWVWRNGERERKRRLQIARAMASRCHLSASVGEWWASVKGHHWGTDSSKASWSKIGRAPRWLLVKVLLRWEGQELIAGAAGTAVKSVAGEGTLTMRSWREGQKLARRLGSVLPLRRRGRVHVHFATMVLLGLPTQMALLRVIAL
jgi:hypothetical protein